MKQQFSEALRGKKIPILTLDNKWYKLLDEETRKTVSGTEEKLNQLLKRQGKLNTETRDIKKLKKKLMNEIVTMADEADQNGSEEINKKIEQHKKLVEECNQRLEEYLDELLELPQRIDQLNFQLMLATMECCYDAMKENTEEIQSISSWVTEVRIELKKRLIKKQEMEQQNQRIYSYMHDIFGADVVNVFDMQYQSEDMHKEKNKKKNKEEMDE